MKKYFSSCSIILISFVVLSGCTTQPTYNPHDQGVEFKNNKAYKKPYLTDGLYLNSYSATVLKDMAGVTSCEEGDILWTYLPNVKNGIWNFWNSTDQEAKLAAKTYGTLDAKKAVWQKFGMTINEMRQNGTAGCSHPMSDQEYNYFMTQQNNQRYQAQQNSYNSATNINAVTQGLNSVTNQLNTMSNQVNTQNQQMQQQSQTYWQNQETKHQLKQLNNNLNGLRYGY